MRKSYCFEEGNFNGFYKTSATWTEVEIIHPITTFLPKCKYFLLNSQIESSYQNNCSRLGTGRSVPLRIRHNGLRYHRQVAQARILFRLYSWHEGKAWKSLHLSGGGNQTGLVTWGWACELVWTVLLWAVDALHFSFLVCMYINTVVISAASATAGTVMSDQCPEGVCLWLMHHPLSYCHARGKSETCSSSCQRIVLFCQVSLRAFSFLLLLPVLRYPKLDPFLCLPPPYNLGREWTLGCVASSAMPSLHVYSCLCYISLKNICTAGVSAISERQE